MAYFTDTTARNDLTGRVLATLAQWFDAAATRRAKRRVYRATFNELASLTNRDLADLGINRSEIKRLAYEAAYLN